MIRSKEDLLFYLRMDSACRNKNNGAPRLNLRDRLSRVVFPQDVPEFQKTLRYLEYLHNQPGGPSNALLKAWTYRKYMRLSQHLGFTIPLNVFGPGLSIAHRGTIIVNSEARVGKNCRLHACVNIGTGAGEDTAPTIGDNVYIGPGAKIFGNITIADGCAIGANAVVNKTFSEPNCAIAGIPAKVIGKVNTLDLMPWVRNIGQVQ